MNKNYEVKESTKTGKAIFAVVTPRNPNKPTHYNQKFAKSRGAEIRLRDDGAWYFSKSPYSFADLANPDCPIMYAIKEQIVASQSLEGKGTLRLPKGKELWPYQKATLDYLLARNGGLNGSPVGLGKTPTSIAFCNAVEAHKVLVIVPASLRLQWQEAILSWTVIPKPIVSVLTVTGKGINPFAHYQIISYEAARKPEILKALVTQTWDVLICDEAHKLKNTRSLTSRAILGNSKKVFDTGKEVLPAISTKCDRMLALTGTLLMNRPSEAYSLFRHFDHEGIGFMSEETFAETYNPKKIQTTRSGKFYAIESTLKETELQNRLRFHIMSRPDKTKALPFMKPPKFSLIRCGQDKAVKEALETENLLDFNISHPPKAEMLGPIATVRRKMGLALAPQIIDYIRDFLEGCDEKIVIFCWHIEVIDKFAKSLKNFGVSYIIGGMTENQKKAAVDKFVQNDKNRVFIGNIQIAGTGLDGLQKCCSICFIAEPDWVPANNEQAVARLDRIGQKNIVTAHIFVAPNSISERILSRALQKMNTIHKVLDGVKK